MADLTETERFWTIHTNSNLELPNKRFFSYREAADEAKKLAMKYVCIAFYVMKLEAMIIAKISVKTFDNSKNSDSPGHPGYCV